MKGYFERAWKRRWSCAAESDLELFRRKWGEEKVADWMRRCNLTAVRPH